MLCLLPLEVCDEVCWRLSLNSALSNLLTADFAQAPKPVGVTLQRFLSLRLRQAG